jgi:hypothetical protein
MPDPAAQRNLPQLREPKVEKSYEPKTQKRPGTMDEWSGFVQRVTSHIDALYRDSRVLRQKRADMNNPTNGPITRREAESNFTATLKRASDHAKELARELLSTGMDREHLQNHLELSATERDRRPEIPLALLYSKLMGIEFEEERRVVERDERGQENSYLKKERRSCWWAKEVKPSDVDELYLTLRPLAEQLPGLASKFKSGSVRLR